VAPSQGVVSQSGVRELELQGIASRIAISREAISRQPQGSVWDHKSEWKTGGRDLEISRTREFAG
jgi:hypothetical protein